MNKQAASGALIPDFFQLLRNPDISKISIGDGIGITPYAREWQAKRNLEKMLNSPVETEK